MDSHPRNKVRWRPAKAKAEHRPLPNPEQPKADIVLTVIAIWLAVLVAFAGMQRLAEAQRIAQANSELAQMAPNRAAVLSSFGN
jgi:hypothetical protein